MTGDSLIIPTVFHRIVDAVAAQFGVQVDLILSTLKSRAVVIPRHVCIYLVRKRTAYSQEDVGRMICRDRTTIIHAERLMEEMLRDPEFAKRVREVERKLDDPVGFVPAFAPGVPMPKPNVRRRATEPEFARTAIIDNLSRAWELVENRFLSDGPHPDTGRRHTKEQNRAEAEERIDKALRLIRGETSAGADEQAK